jgi:hypothetical protein
MDRTDAIAWVLWLGQEVLRKSQAKTLSVLVAAALATARLTLAGIGRELAALDDGAAKHAIKRVWRFITNPRIEPVEVMPALLTRLWRRKLKWHARRPDRRPLLVSLDWTEVRRCHTLLAAVVVEGRAVPLAWESYRDRVQGKSQNALEYGLLARLQAALPPGVRIVVLADRGFGRTAMAEVCQNLKLAYLIRVRADVTVRAPGPHGWSGLLEKYPIRRGECRGWTAVLYRAEDPVTTNLILRWKPGLPADRDEPWYLMTNLPVRGRWTARQLSDLYALRFDIEEFFRDGKNEHLGWSLAKTRIQRADRLDRLILILAVAYLLLVALGLWCRQHRPARTWASNNRERELSTFQIGRVMLDRVRLAIKTLVDLLLRSLATTKGKWG